MDKANTTVNFNSSGAMAHKNKPDNKLLSFKITIKQVPLNISPLEAVETIGEIKRMQKMPISTPEWDNLSFPALNALTSRKELDVAKIELKKKRTRYIKFREEMDEAWKLLEEKETHLRSELISNNTFIIENREKKERAAKQIIFEHGNQAQLKVEIADLTAKMNHLLNVRGSLQENIKKYNMYDVFLRDTVDKSGLGSVHEILLRYQSLSDARTTISLRQERDMQALMDTLEKTKRINADITPLLISLTNEVYELEARYNKAKNLTKYWETAIDRIKNVVFIKNADISLIRAGFWAMYLQACQRRDLPIEIPEDDLDAQITFVKDAIVILKKIVTRARRINARENMTGLLTMSKFKNKMMKVIDKKQTS